MNIVQQLLILVRKNYADLLENGKTKKVGNTLNHVKCLDILKNSWMKVLIYY